MTDAQEKENTKEGPEPIRRPRPPSKKRFEDDVDSLMAEIREKETELKSLTGKNEDTFRSIRAEKEATIERRKKVDTDLRVLNQAITQKMTALSKLQSSLHYTTEEKHNDAIRKLEWNLKVQNFKLSQEKKIVAEIDSLKRSKKMLGQYLSMKKEIDETRDRQRRMREERDHYFRSVNQLKAREEDIRRKNFTSKNRAEVLKKEINELYEKKRSMVSEFRKQKEVFSDIIKRQRAESFRKREEERQAHQKEMEELAALKEPFEDEISLCKTLISYLSKICPTGEMMDTGPNLGIPSTEEVQTSQGGPALENEEGYRLLRKSDDSDEFPALGRRASKNRRRSRKLSMTKPVTHTPHVLSQFSSLNLNAPSSLTEISASMEQLQGRKLYYEQEAGKVKSLNLDATSDVSLSELSGSRRARIDTWGFLGEGQPIMEELSQSEAGVSATESVLCEMSRQASKTESCESATDTRPSDMLMEELLQTCCDGNYSNPPKSDFHDIDSHSVSDSESTLEGSNGESMGSGNDFEKELHSDSCQADIRLCTSNKIGTTLNTSEDKPRDSSISVVEDQADCDTQSGNPNSSARCDRTLDVPTESVPCDSTTQVKRDEEGTGENSPVQHKGAPTV